MEDILLTRCANNPILKPVAGQNWECATVSNAGAALHDGRVVILYRAGGTDIKESAPRWPVSRLGFASSPDGFNFDQRRAQPAVDVDREREWVIGADGVEDPRITKIGDTYHIVYAVTSLEWDRLAHATTRDFVTFEKHGLLLGHVAQRTAGLFPETVKGKYLLMHRPIPNIWISESDDMKTFGNPRLVMTTKVAPWCELKLGLGGPPIRGKNAWILIFHGRDRKRVYRLGIAWLDLEDPTRIIKVQNAPILEPTEPYEKGRDIYPDCVYACGHVELGGKLIVYYGCGDSFLAAASVDRDALEI